MVTLGGWLMLLGSVVFFVGAAYGVPRVFTVREPDERLALLQAGADAWRRAQWLYAAGPLLAAMGVVVLGTAWSGEDRLLAGGAGIAMLVGAVLWSVSCARRGRRIEEFARGELPASSWLGYVWLTLAGLALLGVACLGFATWVGVVVLIAAVAFVALFVVTRDIPPFVFYVVLTIVGIWVIAAQPQ
ncbi:hypothetical protein [Tessaracoccus sp. G1721]